MSWFSATFVAYPCMIKQLSALELSFFSKLLHNAGFLSFSPHKVGPLEPIELINLCGSPLNAFYM
jgi:hypothetical protein